jgi:hypothetical protein
MTYLIGLFDSVVTDGQDIDVVVHDIPRDVHALRIQALVASGDYFETLAAKLEQIADALPVHSVEQFQIQDAIGQLLYLQRSYAITKKVDPNQ